MQHCCAGSQEGLGTSITGALLTFVGGPGTPDVFAPICNVHDICYQNPSKTADDCNNQIATSFSQFCDEAFDIGKAVTVPAGPGPDGPLTYGLATPQYQWLAYVIAKNAACHDAGNRAAGLIR